MFVPRYMKKLLPDFLYSLVLLSGIHCESVITTCLCKMGRRRNIAFSFHAVLLAMVLLLSSCGSSVKKSEIAGNVSISGAFALYPMAVQWAMEFHKIHPDVQVDISAGGAGKGITDALCNMVDLGMVSRSISPEEIAQGTWFIAVARDVVIPVVNASNPVIDSLQMRGLTREQMESVFINHSITNWDQCFHTPLNGRINVYTRSDACGAGEMWARYLGKLQDDIQGIGVYGDPGMADALKEDKNGIGYNNLIFAYDLHTREVFHGLAVVPVDLNGNRMIDDNENFYQNMDSLMLAVQHGLYPSPPGRELYFACKGKPSGKAVVAFLRWILTEGQQYLSEAGYIKLPPDMAESELKKLD